VCEKILAQAYGDMPNRLPTGFHYLEDGGKDIGEPQDTDDCSSLSHQQRLMMPPDEHMDAVYHSAEGKIKIMYPANT
jgi:hypothetical protein